MEYGYSMTGPRIYKPQAQIVKAMFKGDEILTIKAVANRLGSSTGTAVKVLRKANCIQFSRGLWKRGI